MNGDARFEEGIERPLHLKAFDEDDLQTISSLLQDAVVPLDQITWDRRHRRLGLLINRFRCERGADAAPERVQSVLAIEDVVSVASQGVRPGDAEDVSSILAIQFEPGEDGAGRVVLVLAGDGAIAARVEALEITLKDVTRPYEAPSGSRPNHDLA